jgi:hypothetical protein
MQVRESALPANRTVRPERLESSGNSLAVVRPKLPSNPSPAPTVTASRGSATRATAVNLSGNGQASRLANPNTASPPNTTATASRPGLNNATPPASRLRDPNTVRQQENLAITSPNATASRTEPANRPAQVQSGVRPNPQAAPPVARRDSAPTTTARNDTPAPVVRNRPAGQASRLAPPQQQNQAPVTRSAPPVQAAPQTRSSSPMIRSYAEPQRNFQNAAPPQSRLGNPMAMPQHSVRPQVSAPPPATMSRPSLVPSTPAHSAPSSSGGRSAPSSGGGGNSGGGGRGRGSGP